MSCFCLLCLMFWFLVLLCPFSVSCAFPSCACLSPLSASIVSSVIALHYPPAPHLFISVCVFSLCLPSCLCEFVASVWCWLCVMPPLSSFCLQSLCMFCWILISGVFNVWFKLCCWFALCLFVCILFYCFSCYSVLDSFRLLPWFFFSFSFVWY